MYQIYMLLIILFSAIQTPFDVDLPHSNSGLVSSAEMNNPILTSGNPVTITTIKMIDEEIGWAIGNQGDNSDHILFTQDGASTWKDRTPPITETSSDEYQIATAYFLSEQLAWALFTPQYGPPSRDANFQIWYTHDAGNTWQQSEPLQLTGLEEYFIPEAFAFTGRYHGWLLVHIGAGMSHDYSHLYATKNGGRTWKRVIDPYGDGLQSLRNTGIAFADNYFGWVSKDNLGIMPGAYVEQTQNGGLSWENNFLPAPEEHDWFNEISQCQTSSPTFTSPHNAALIVKCRIHDENTVDYRAWSLTYIYTTQDRGKTWEHSLLPTPVDHLVFNNVDSSLALGRDIYQSTDGGLSWVEQKSVHWDGQFSFVDDQLGWAVARNDDEIALVKTSNGGQTWQIVEPVME